MSLSKPSFIPTLLINAQKWSHKFEATKTQKIDCVLTKKKFSTFNPSVAKQDAVETWFCLDWLKLHSMRYFLWPNWWIECLFQLQKLKQCFANFNVCATTDSSVGWILNESTAFGRSALAHYRDSSSIFNHAYFRGHIWHRRLRSRSSEDVIRTIFFRRYSHRRAYKQKPARLQSQAGKTKHCVKEECRQRSF